MKNAPCYECQERSEICHAQCTRYHDWVLEVKSERDAARAGRDADAHTKRTIEINSKRAKTRRVVGQR